MPMTLIDSEFFEEVMAKNREPEKEYRIKDPPREEGIDFWEFIKMLGKALAVAYMIYSFLRIFA
jgi:hypothetical protein